MKTDNTSASWDDLIFESRNKEYGAYRLRKSHNENVTKGFFAALLIVAFVFGAVQVASLFHVEIKIPHPHFPTVPQFPPKVIAERPVKTTVRREPNVNRDLQVRVVTQEIEPAPVKPAEPTTPGAEPGTSTGGPVEGVDPGTVITETPVTIDPPKILVFAEVMPEYEGGTIAMRKFLGKNLRYPASERSVGTEGTVYVRFVVNSVGQVVDAEIVKGVSAMLDREALRVVLLMTKWKPGMQNKLPVNVRMVIPIKFQMEHL